MANSGCVSPSTRTTGMRASLVMSLKGPWKLRHGSERGASPTRLEEARWYDRTIAWLSMVVDPRHHPPISNDAVETSAARCMLELMGPLAPLSRRLALRREHGGPANSGSSCPRGPAHGPRWWAPPPRRSCDTGASCGRATDPCPGRLVAPTRGHGQRRGWGVGGLVTLQRVREEGGVGLGDTRRPHPARPPRPDACPRLGLACWWAPPVAAPLPLFHPPPVEGPSVCTPWETLIAGPHPRARGFGP